MKTRIELYYESVTESVTDSIVKGDQVTASGSQTCSIEQPIVRILFLPWSFLIIKSSSRRDPIPASIYHSALQLPLLDPAASPVTVACFVVSAG